MAATAGSGSPCGACKFLRRKCTTHCIFAPYFCTEQDPARFAAIHKVFGASNVAKLLQHLAVPDRCDAVVSIAYEAQARIKDPVYGCVAHIFALQQQVACLQAQLMQVRAQMGQGYMYSTTTLESQQSANHMTGSMISYQNYMNVPNFNTSTHSLIDPSRNCRYNDGDDDALFKRISESDLGELQELAVRMMRN